MKKQNVFAVLSMLLAVNVALSVSVLAQKEPVVLISSKLVYYPDGPRPFGAPSPFGVSIKLKLPSGTFDKVAVVFIGDAQRLETKTVTFVTGRPDTIDLESRNDVFTYAKDKKVEVHMFSRGQIVGRPYLLIVPKPVFEGLQ